MLPPDVDAFAYLDLGCGNGFTPAPLAAARPRWHRRSPERGVAVSASEQLKLDAARPGVLFDDDAQPAERSRRDGLTALAMLGIA